MKLIPFILLFLYMGFWAGCQSDGNQQKSNNPLSAAETLLAWQKQVDLGHFAKAKEWSTPSTIQWLQDIAEIQGDDEVGAPTNIQDIQCDFYKDTADCSYLIIEEDEKIPNTIQLVKINDKWLVDVHDEEE